MHYRPDVEPLDASLVPARHRGPDSAKHNGQQPPCRGGHLALGGVLGLPDNNDVATGQTEHVVHFHRRHLAGTWQGACPRRTPQAGQARTTSGNGLVGADVLLA